MQNKKDFVHSEWARIEILDEFYIFGGLFWWSQTSGIASIKISRCNENMVYVIIIHYNYAQEIIKRSISIYRIQFLKK